MRIPGLMKRGKIWYLRTRKGGTDVWRSLGTRDFREAEKRALGVLAGTSLTDSAQIEPVPPPHKGKTVKEFAPTWLELYVNQNRKDQGIINAKARLSRYILPCLGDVELRNVTIHHSRQLRAFCEAFKEPLREGVGRRLKKGDSLSPQTIVHVLREWSNLLTAAVEEGEIPYRPFSKRVLPKIHRTPEILTAAQEKEVLGLLQEEQPLFYAHVLLALKTGMRWSEVSNAQWKDFQETPDPRLTLFTTKGNKPRTLPLSKEAVAAIKWIEANLGGQEERETILPHLGKSDSILKHVQSRVPFHFTFHMLRRTYATTMANRGMDKAALQMILGHSTVRVAEQHYIQTSDFLSRREVDRLDSLPA